MAGKSRPSFQKTNRERNKRKKREDKLLRRQERREAKVSGTDDGTVPPTEEIDMEGLFGLGGRAEAAEAPGDQP